MDNTLWLQNGKLIVDSSGSPLLCTLCPCIQVPSFLYTIYTQLIVINAAGLVGYRSLLVFLLSVSSSLLLPAYEVLLDRYGLYKYGQLGTNHILCRLTPIPLAYPLRFRGAFMFCFTLLLLSYMGIPAISFNYYSQLTGSLLGIWPAIVSKIDPVYSGYVLSQDAQLILPAVLQLFPDMLLSLFAEACSSIFNRVIHTSLQGADSLFTKYVTNTALTYTELVDDLNKEANKVYQLYYSTLPKGKAYSSYTLAKLQLLSSQQLLVDTVALGILLRFVECFQKKPSIVELLFGNDKLLALLLRMAVPQLCAFSLVYGESAQLPRYTALYLTIATLIWQAIVDARADIANQATILLRLSLSLDDYLLPTEGQLPQSVALRVTALRDLLNTAKYKASQTIASSMAYLKQSISSLMHTLLGDCYYGAAASFLNIGLTVRPMRTVRVRIRISELQLELLSNLLVYKSQYVPTASTITGGTATPVVQWWLHCTKGVVPMTAYTAIPSYYGTAEAGALLLFTVYNMAKGTGSSDLDDTACWYANKELSFITAATIYVNTDTRADMVRSIPKTLLGAPPLFPWSSEYNQVTTREILIYPLALALLALSVLLLFRKLEALAALFDASQLYTTVLLQRRDAALPQALRYPAFVLASTGDGGVITRPAVLLSGYANSTTYTFTSISGSVRLKTELLYAETPLYKPWSGSNKGKAALGFFTNWLSDSCVAIVGDSTVTKNAQTSDIQHFWHIIGALLIILKLDMEGSTGFIGVTKKLSHQPVTVYSICRGLDSNKCRPLFSVTLISGPLSLPWEPFDIVVDSPPTIGYSALYGENVLLDSDGKQVTLLQLPAINDAQQLLSLLPLELQ